MIRNVLEMLAFIWLIIGDFTAILALLGAGLTAPMVIIDAFRGRSPNRAFKRMPEGIYGALFISILLFVSVMVSEQISNQNTMILGFSRVSVAAMLASAVLLLLASVFLSRLIRRTQ